MSTKAATTRTREEMLTKLIEFSREHYLQENLYPRFLELAGQEIPGPTLVMLMTLAIHDMTQGMPTMAQGVLMAKMPKFIDAMMGDEEAATEAKDFYRNAVNVD